MKGLQRWHLISGLMLAGVAVQSAGAQLLETQPKFTVFVNNYAKIDAKQLADAERTAGEIFGKAGVASTWVNVNASGAQDSISTDENAISLSHIYVRILPQLMVDQFTIPSDRTGIGPWQRS